MNYAAQMKTQTQNDTQASCLFMLACLPWCGGRMAALHTYYTLLVVHVIASEWMSTLLKVLAGALAEACSSIQMQ